MKIALEIDFHFEGYKKIKIFINEGIEWKTVLKARSVCFKKVI